MEQETRILIIEDSPTQAAVIAELVRQVGFKPVVYTEVRSGIVSILQREQPSLILLDLKLLDADGQQVADGFQLCREVKKSPYRIPVVVVTAEGDDEACEWALLQGADGFLQKPFKATDLINLISQVLPSAK